jgi:hypothetical protein
MALRDNYENIPLEMRQLQRWTLHKVEPGKNGKLQKVPYQATGQHASSTDAKTWTHFPQSVPAGFDGVSFALAASDGLVCVDIDGGRNPETEQPRTWARQIIDDLDSYTDVSPSGTGYHVWVKSKIPKASHKKDSSVELYADAKIMATTGRQDVFVGSSEIAERDLSDLFRRAEAAEFVPPEKRTPKTPSQPVVASNGDESAEDYRLLARLVDEIHATNCVALVEEFAKRYPDRFTKRNREKGNRNGRSYIEYTATNLLKKIGVQPVAPVDQPGSGPNGDKIWRDVFHLGSELDSQPGRIFIKGFLEEGITAVGSLSGVGKTWIGLSIAHALTTGEKLFGAFPVIEQSNVLYLVPEMGGRKFRERMVKMRMPMDGRFFCQTIRDGACDLRNNSLLLAAIEDMRPVVVLDTAIRFQTGEENSSTDQAQGLGASIMNLIRHGAGAVICMHHRKKDAGNEDLSLENALRGSGDFGAMADCVWAVENARRKVKNKFDPAYTEESKHLTRLYLECVKPRDMEPVDPFVIQGRPYIDQKGDFVVLATGNEGEAVQPQSNDGDAKVLEIVKNDPTAGVRAIKRATGYGSDRIYRILKANHFSQVGGQWQCESLLGSELVF